MVCGNIREAGREGGREGGGGGEEMRGDLPCLLILCPMVLELMSVCVEV
jgi:hypothetical protein